MEDKKDDVPAKEVKKEEESKNEEHKIIFEGKLQAPRTDKKIEGNSIWRIISGILLLLLVISIFTHGFGGCTGECSKDTNGQKVLTEDGVKQKLISYINDNLMQPGTTATVTNVEESSGGLYKVKINIKGNEFDSYVTKDGNYLIPDQRALIDINKPVEKTQTGGNEESEKIEKSDKPTAELYIFSYCPAGSSTLDSFAEAGKLLKDVADVKVKFFSEMHGEYEKQQNIIQDCIQKVDKDKYWDYATLFLENVYRVCGSQRDIGCDKTESSKLMKKVGIDSDVVMKCLENEGVALYEQDKKDASSLELRYSPSIVLNGVYLQNADRTPSGLKNLICSAFNTKPVECTKDLSEKGAESTGNC